MRVLDLGCGYGCDLTPWGILPSDEVTGIDVNPERLAVARNRFPERSFRQARAEDLPFPLGSFDRVISLVALPYTRIPAALREIHRVLVPGGGLLATLHPPRFTVSELVHHALPRPLPTAFRLYVLVNGCWFHSTGQTIPFLAGRTESFQTEDGMRIALKRAGFFALRFERRSGPVGDIFSVEARKAAVSANLATKPKAA
jgi:ubiquinone/menaquinone biosynthesis C-methylase UbiE